MSRNRSYHWCLLKLCRGQNCLWSLLRLSRNRNQPCLLSRLLDHPFTAPTVPTSWRTTSAFVPAAVTIPAIYAVAPVAATDNSSRQSWNRSIVLTAGSRSVAFSPRPLSGITPTLISKVAQPFWQFIAISVVSHQLADDFARWRICWLAYRQHRRLPKRFPHPGPWRPTG